MQRSRSALALVVLTAAAASAVGSTGCRKSLVDGPMTWESDVDVAFARSHRENKPVVVYFGAAWDNAAMELERVTFVDPEVRLLLGRDFVSVHVDTTDEDHLTRKLQQRFNVVGDPTLVVVAADGITELVRFNEFIPPATLTQALRRATRSDAIPEARFEAAARKRADQKHWEEEWRKANLSPAAAATVVSFPDESGIDPQ